MCVRNCWWELCWKPEPFVVCMYVECDLCMHSHKSSFSVKVCTACVHVRISYVHFVRYFTFFERTRCVRRKGRIEKCDRSALLVRSTC